MSKMTEPMKTKNSRSFGILRRELRRDHKILSRDPVVYMVKLEGVLRNKSRSPKKAKWAKADVVIEDFSRTLLELSSELSRNDYETYLYQALGAADRYEHKGRDRWERDFWYHNCAKIRKLAEKERDNPNR